MALVTTFICKECHETKDECVTGLGINQVCNSCRAKIAQNKRAQHLLGLKSLTIEERISIIEAWIYDFKPGQNFNDIKYG